MATVEERIAELRARQATTARWLIGLLLFSVASVVVGLVLMLAGGALAAFPVVASLAALLSTLSCLLVLAEGVAILVVFFHGRGLAEQAGWLHHLLALMRRHGCDEETALRITRGEVWEGMLEAMLLDARGHPVTKDHKRFKGVVREVWKYHQTGRGRFATRIIVDQGVVIGWQINQQ